MTTITFGNSLPVRRYPRSAQVLVVLAAVLTTASAAASGLAVGSGSKTAVVLPVAVVVALMLGVIAMTRFAAYLFLMLLLRASVDLGKLSGASAGNTTTNGTGRGLDPSSMLAVLFLLAAVVWLAARYREQGGRLPGSSLRRSIVVFGAASVLSITGSAAPLVSALEGLRVLAVVVMFVVLEQLMQDRAQMRRLLLAAFLSLAFPLLYTVARSAMGSPPSEVKGSFSRITGTFSQSNTFGRYLMIMIIAGVAMYPHVGKRARTALAVALSLSGVFLLLTYTRTALVGTVIGLVVVGRLQSKRVLLGLVAAALVALIFVPQMSSRFSSVASTSAGPSATPSGNSLAWRLSYWADVLPLAAHNPVTGIGLNMTQYKTPAQKQPHNDFIRAFVETGVIGFIAYLAMLWSLVAMGRRAVRVAPPNSMERGVAVGFLGCALAFVAVSCAANVMSNVVTLWYLVVFAAAASAVAARGEARRLSRVSDSHLALIGPDRD